MGLEAARELDCGALGALLREPREAERTLLLDCRPFLAFCRRHVRAARPVPWNALLRRRARGPPAAALACLLPDRALRARLARGELARVVVLDEGSASVAELAPDGPAHVLLAALLHETRAGPTAVCFLRGGFDGFQACCPDLCSESPVPALPPAAAENSRSDARAPFYDQGGPVEILPYLFLGSCSHSADLQGLQACGITAVLNVSASCPNHFEGLLHYKSIPVEDNQMVEISAWFQEAIGFIGKREGLSPGTWRSPRGGAWSTCLLFCPPSCLTPLPHFPCRLCEEQRRPGAGTLPGGHLALRHHLPGLPDTEPPRAAGRGLRLC
uniref:protein-tyrosine-phosphatase n=1 Tax=Equus caballus TaxID=9796 RepID=A0A5F5PMC8_HORSE